MATRSALDRDKLNQASIPEVTHAAVAIADTLQRLPPHVRVLGAAAFLSLLVERMDLPAQDVMTAIGNMRNTADRLGVVEFKAVEAYLKEDF